MGSFIDLGFSSYDAVAVITVKIYLPGSPVDNAPVCHIDVCVSNTTCQGIPVHYCNIMAIRQFEIFYNFVLIYSIYIISFDYNIKTVFRFFCFYSIPVYNICV